MPESTTKPIVAGWRTVMHDIAIRRILSNHTDWRSDEDLSDHDEHLFYEVDSPNWPSMCLFISVHQSEDMATAELTMEVREPNWGEPIVHSVIGNSLHYVGGIMLAEPLVRIAVERWRATGLL